MSVLKHCLLTKKWIMKVCFCKNVKVQYYSQVLVAEKFLDKHVKKIVHPTRFYTSEKYGQNITNKSTENVNTNEKPQESSSVGKRKNVLNCSEKRGTVSVAVVGGGCTTLCTCILLKQNPAIKEIRLIDTDNSIRLSVCDIRQIDTTTKIKHYERNSILDGLRDIDVVVLMDETNLAVGNKGPFSQFVFSSNFVKHVAECMTNACPDALIVVFTHPVTAAVPLISEIYKKGSIYNPNKIIGSAALDSMRINAITANFLDLNPSCIKVPITGGIDPLTLVPLLSKTTPFNNLTEEDQHALVQQLKSANDYFFENESQGPTLSAGLAANKFISTLICGKQNHSNICVANAFVRSNIYPSCQYIASKVQFGPDGIKKIFDLPKVSLNELFLIEQSVPIINRTVDSVKHFVKTGNVK